MPYLPLLARIYSLIMRSNNINQDMIYRMNKDIIYDNNPAKRDFSYNPNNKFII